MIDRKIIQIIYADRNICGLCNRGELWRRVEANSGSGWWWERLPTEFED